MRDLTVMTLATHEAGCMPALVESCKRLSISLDVFGMGSPISGLGWKLHTMYRYLSTQKKSGTVLFTDAFDSVILKPAGLIMEEYKALNFPLVMSAEANCFPASPLHKFYPEAPTRYRYVNSGGWIGDAEYMRDLLHSLSAACLPDTLNDQGVLADYYISRPDSMRLDHQCRIFQCLFAADEDLFFDGTAIKNVVTGSQPAVIHGNGGTDMTQVLRWATL